MFFQKIWHELLNRVRWISALHYTAKYDYEKAKSSLLKLNGFDVHNLMPKDIQSGVLFGYISYQLGENKTGKRVLDSVVQLIEMNSRLNAESKKYLNGYIQGIFLQKEYDCFEECESETRSLRMLIESIDLSLVPERLKVDFPLPVSPDWRSKCKKNI